MLLTMVVTSLGRTIALAGMAAVALAGFSARAAIGEGDSSVAPSGQGWACARSTDTVKQLAVIENASEGTFQCLGLSLEGETVKAIRLETHSFTSPPGHPDAERVVIAEFPAAVVESNHGAVLDGVPGHDAIILQGHLSTPSRVKQLVTSYLYNGITGEYRSCQITLDRAPDAGWRLVNRFAQTISHIVVKTRQIPLIGDFGIASLDGACS
jgi:hypothetical protein